MSELAYLKTLALTSVMAVIFSWIIFVPFEKCTTRLAYELLIATFNSGFERRSFDAADEGAVGNDTSDQWQSTF
jgi:hypothetical protein